MSNQTPLKRELNNLRALLADKNKQINILKFKLENREKFINNITLPEVKSNKAESLTRLGESNGRSKLKWSDIIHIRTFSKSGTPNYVLAKTFNVNQSTVHKILNNKIWKSKNYHNEQAPNTN